jgi:hypothetical protein
MIKQVHILATVRTMALLDAALLVFRTLRTGFPTATVMVWGNGLELDALKSVGNAAASVGATFRNSAYLPHDGWIEGLVQGMQEPFWICDTDMVFFDRVEDWFDSDERVVFAGRYEPAFAEEWTKTQRAARLHTALMYFNPSLTRQAMRSWMCRIPRPWRDSAVFPLIKQAFIPTAGKTMFFDSCAGLYQACGGTRFTEEQDNAFEHLHCGTYADLITPHLSVNLIEAHRLVYANPALAKGIRERQNEYYASRS